MLGNIVKEKMHIGGDFFCPARKLLKKIRFKVKFFRIFDETLLFTTQEAHYGKAIRTFYTQNQASKKPLTAPAA